MVDHVWKWVIAWFAGFTLIAGSASADNLRLERVLLSSGGVGYFEFRAVVDGDAELLLSVPLVQVDDVLKSLVITDDRGGAGIVSYPGREPLEQYFRDLPFGPAALRSPAALLNALQGSRVRVKGLRQLDGRLMGTAPETVKLPDGLGTVTRHRLSILTEVGVEQTMLEDAGTVSFTDPALQRQLGEALDTVAAHREQGRRTVTVAYVVTAPLWKSTYRLALPAHGEKTALLQGWAAIDNLSGQDWQDVELTLVSGNPVTFHQALYAAYHVDRPEVPVEVMGRILPPPDEGAVANEPRERKTDAETGAVSYGMAGTEAAVVEGARLLADEPSAAGRLAAATAAEAATQIVFRISQSVTVPHGQSLMAPIVDRSVPASGSRCTSPRLTFATRWPVFA